MRLLLFIASLLLTTFSPVNAGNKWLITSSFSNNADRNIDLELKVRFQNLDSLKPQLLEIVTGRPNISLEIMGVLYGAIFVLPENDGENSEAINVNGNAFIEFTYKLSEFRTLENDQIFQRMLLERRGGNSSNLRIIYKEGNNNLNLIFGNNFFYPQSPSNSTHIELSISNSWSISCKWNDDSMPLSKRILLVTFRNTDPDRYRNLHTHYGKPNITLEVMGQKLGAPFKSIESSEESSGGAFAPVNYGAKLIAPLQEIEFEYSLSNFSSGFGEDYLDKDLLLEGGGRRLRVVFREDSYKFVFSNTINM